MTYVPATAASSAPYPDLEQNNPSDAGTRQIQHYNHLGMVLSGMANRRLQQRRLTSPTDRRRKRLWVFASSKATFQPRFSPSHSTNCKQHGENREPWMLFWRLRTHPGRKGYVGLRFTSCQVPTSCTSPPDELGHDGTFHHGAHVHSAFQEDV